jgi:hypothetical protein
VTYTYRRADGAGDTSIVVVEGTVSHFALRACADAQARTRGMPSHERELVRTAQLPLVDRVEQLALEVLKRDALIIELTEELQSARRDAIAERHSQH